MPLRTAPATGDSVIPGRAHSPRRFLDERRNDVSIMLEAVQSLAVQTVWQGEGVEVVALGTRDASGFFSPRRFEVHIPGDAVLYRSDSQSAAFHYLDILLGYAVMEN
jgi:hypothetical protein|tara:strand:+ start:849 stop:1169 length:321 start_codon:yes stop_codon:yes gene_type:complete